MFKDLQFSVRTLFAQPAFAAVAIVTLALGIGASAAIFSILNAVLIRQLPYHDPERLYMLRSMAPNGTMGLMAPRWVEPFIAGNASVEAAAFGWGLAGSIIAADGTPYPFLPYRVTPRDRKSFLVHFHHRHGHVELKETIAVLNEAGLNIRSTMKEKKHEQTHPTNYAVSVVR